MAIFALIIIITIVAAFTVVVTHFENFLHLTTHPIKLVPPPETPGVRTPPQEKGTKKKLQIKKKKKFEQILMILGIILCK